MCLSCVSNHHQNKIQKDKAAQKREERLLASAMFEVRRHECARVCSDETLVSLLHGSRCAVRNGGTPTRDQ